jgi:hypothetical protein
MRRLIRCDCGGPSFAKSSVSTIFSTDMNRFVAAMHIRSSK